MIIQQLNHWARTNPDKPAVEADGVLVSFRRFVRLIEATRRCIAEAQPKPGALAVVLIHNLFDCWLAALACEALGLVCICVRDAEAIEALQLRSAGLIILSELESSRHDLAALADLRQIILCSAIYRPAEIKGLGHIVESNTDHGGFIYLSSGSSGQAKKILYRKNDEATILDHWRSFHKFEPHTRLHIFNLALSGSVANRSARAAWCAGACVVLDQTENFLDLKQFSSASVVRLTPELARGLSVKNAGTNALSIGARTFIAGGAITLEIIESLRRLLGPEIVQIYGATEVSVGFLTPIRTPEDLVWHRPSGVIPVEVVDARGHPVANGAEGVLRFPVGEWCVREYLDDPESSARAFRDGCFYPGDLAIRRSDGRVRILGRVSDVIIVNGHKSSLSVFEGQMRGYLHVDEACAFATQLPTSEDVLFVALRAPESPAASLLQQVKTFLPSFDDIRFVTFPSFPLTPTGKTDRMQLRTAILKASTGKEM